MVLENSSSQDPDVSYESEFSIASDSPGQKNYDVNLAGLPMPFPGGAPFGWTKPHLVRWVGAHIETAIKSMGRPPTQDEVSALARIAAKEYRTLSFGTPLGVAAGLYRAYDTRDSWRFPWYKMSSGWSPNTVRLPGLGEVLQGELAKTFWRGARMSAYAVVGGVFGIALFTPYAATVASIERLSDPRLRAYVESFTKAQAQAQAQARMKRMGQPDPVSNQAPQQRDIYGQGQTNAGDLWKNHRQAIGGREVDYDDASPTGGQAMDAYLDSGYNQTTSSGTSSENKTPQNSASRARAPNPQRTSSTWGQPAPTPDQSYGSSSGVLSDFDDASGASSSSEPTSSSAPSGSAWDRIRQNSGNSTPQPSRSERFHPQQQPRQTPDSDSNTSGDRGFFSSAEEDRQLARSEAQKEFDDRLERERQGGDFNSPEESGARRRW